MMGNFNVDLSNFVSVGNPYLGVFHQSILMESSGVLYLCAVFSFYAVFMFFSQKPSCKCDTNLKSKIVVITGGTDGVGKETALELARRGAQLILPCRNLVKGRVVADEIKHKTGNDSVALIYADFECLQSVKSCVDEIRRQTSKIDILINNAGIGNGVALTHDGFPQIFGVNHLGPYLLTTRLLQLLRKSESPRVIFVSSVAHFWGKINFLTLKKRDGSWVPAQFRAYAQSKLANVLFARELNRREQKISTFVAHPGWTFTAIFRDFPFLLKIAVFPLFYLFLYHPKVGAQTQIHLALAQNLQKYSGGYFVSCKPSKTCSAAMNRQLANNLWTYSERAVVSVLSSVQEPCNLK